MREMAEYNEQNFRELLRVIRHYCPKLFDMFQGKPGEDPRHASYIVYDLRLILTTLFLKYLLSIESMREMTRLFLQGVPVKNALFLSGADTTATEVPHAQTINDTLKRMKTDILERIRKHTIISVIRSKLFNEGRFRKKWLIAIDGTHLSHMHVKPNEECLVATHGKNTEHEIRDYYQAVLEARLCPLGTSVALSIGSEFMSNEPQGSRTDEDYKQDCEQKAFYRLVGRLRKEYPRLPMCFLGDSLYAQGPVMHFILENKCDFILRYKDGSIPFIANHIAAHQDQLKPADDGQGFYNIRYMNGVKYVFEKTDQDGHKTKQCIELNYLKASSTVQTDGESKEIEFQWLTNMNMNKHTAAYFAEAGRQRWKIENQGFNRQKNWVDDMTHLCCWDATGARMHYLMMQLADIFRMLLEYRRFTKREIKIQYKPYLESLRNTMCTILFDQSFITGKAENCVY